MDTTLTAVRWDEEYRQGRYIDESPVPFVTTIATTLENFNLTQNAIGLYVGCGNGRNYIPLVDMGLNLYGLDVSQEAIAYLTAQRPQQSPKLCCKDFLGFQKELSARTEEEFAIVVEPREDVIRRSPPKTGSWVQWEGIWQRR